jgi:hypothetical protein
MSYEMTKYLPKLKAYRLGDYGLEEYDFANDIASRRGYSLERRAKIFAIYVQKYLREYLGGPAKNFYWIDKKGRSHRPKDMATPYLFYSLRMLFNNTVSPVFRVAQDEFIRYNDVKTWPLSYIERAGEELLKELRKRNDLDTEHRNQLNDILANTEVIRKLSVINV